MIPPPPPGQDPVFDHTWCCEHPDPWHYFDPEALARLLSGLRRVYRVDPVEAAWSLRIVEWAATEAAIPVLQEIVTENMLPPQTQRIAAKVLARLEHELSQTPESPAPRQVEPPPDHATLDMLLAQLSDAQSPAERARIADALARKAEVEPQLDKKVAAISELLCERHPMAPELLEKWVIGKRGTALNTEMRTQLMLATAAAQNDKAYSFLERLLLHDSGGLLTYDVYEAIKSLVDRPPPGFDDVARQRLLDGLRRTRVFTQATPADAGQLLVITAALGGETVSAAVRAQGSFFRRLFSAEARRTRWHRYFTDALGYIGDEDSIRILGRLLRSRRLGIRAAAAVSLRRIHSVAAAQTLVDHVRTDVLTGKVPFDIDGVQVVRHAFDMAVLHRPKNAADTLALVLKTDRMEADDIADRAAIGLCILGDERCLTTRKDTGLPKLLHAVLSHQDVRRGEVLGAYIGHAARWLNDRYQAGFTIPAEPMGQLARVYLQRAMLVWWRNIGQHLAPPQQYAR